MGHHGNHEARTDLLSLTQAQKYTSWAKAGDASTAGITMESVGAKESVACVLSARPKSPQTGVAPKATP